MMSNHEKTKEYAFRVVPAEAVQEYLNAQGEQGYALMNIQPFARKIKDTQEGTQEEVFTFAITMERPRNIVIDTKGLDTTSITMPPNPEVIPMLNPA